MRFVVYMQNPEEREALCRCLHTWCTLSCAPLEIVTVSSYDEEPGVPSIFFWDLDGGAPPPRLLNRERQALFVCSSNGQNVIQSYSAHPTGFLQKPIRMAQLTAALRRCIALWWDCLERLELLSDRVRVRIPFCELLCAEGTRRGCLLHTSCQSIAAREPLYSLEERLPPALFIRCQRSFVVNLLHVRTLTGGMVSLSNGTEIPLGRGSKATVAAAYRQFRLLLDGLSPQPPENTEAVIP